MVRIPHPVKCRTEGRIALLQGMADITSRTRQRLGGGRAAHAIAGGIEQGDSSGRDRARSARPCARSRPRGRRGHGRRGRPPPPTPGRRFDLEKSRAGGGGPLKLCAAEAGVGSLGAPVQGEQRPEGAVGSALRRCRPDRCCSIHGAVHLVSRRPSAHGFRVGRGAPGLDERQRHAAQPGGEAAARCAPGSRRGGTCFQCQRPAAPAGCREQPGDGRPRPRSAREARGHDGMTGPAQGSADLWPPHGR